MNPQEYLERIKAKHGSKEDIIIVSDYDVCWLIARVEQLEGALSDVYQIGEFGSDIREISFRAINTGPKPE